MKEKLIKEAKRMLDKCEELALKLYVDKENGCSEYWVEHNFNNFLWDYNRLSGFLYATIYYTDTMVNNELLQIRNKASQLFDNALELRYH